MNLEALEAEQVVLQELYIKYLEENKLENADPYPFQMKFFADMSKTIGLQAANQIGKTLSGTMWDAFDLTGLYPEWWTGYKFEKPIKLVCGGVNNDKTRDVLQDALLGDPLLIMGSDDEESSLGKGWIPKSCVGKSQMKRGVPNAVLHQNVRHYTNGIFDGWSRLTFLAYEMGAMTWMAHKADVNHLDEEPPLPILEQAGRSTIATGGRTRLTYTPEQGRTAVVAKIEKDWSFHRAEWSDVAGEDFEIDIDGDILEFKKVTTLKGRAGHLTKQKVLDAQAKFMPYQMKMRARGIPVLGSGLVFARSEEDIKIEPITIPEHWLRGDAIDFGGLSSTAHPTAFARLAYDEDNDVIYVYDGFRLVGKEIPEISAHIIAKPHSDTVPVFYPHDGNKITGQGGSTRDQYAACGVNMWDTHVTNPPMDSDIEGKGGIQILPGITDMSSRMADGRFKVFSTVLDFFEEFRQFHMKDGKIVDLDDDFISACRYGSMFKRHMRTIKKKHRTLNTIPSGTSWQS